MESINTLQEFRKMDNISIAIQISRSREKIDDPVLVALEEAIESAAEGIDEIDDMYGNRRLEES